MIEKAENEWSNVIKTLENCMEIIGNKKIKNPNNLKDEIKKDGPSFAAKKNIKHNQPLSITTKES